MFQDYGCYTLAKRFFDLQNKHKIYKYLLLLKCYEIVRDVILHHKYYIQLRAVKFVFVANFKND